MPDDQNDEENSEDQPRGLRKRIEEAERRAAVAEAENQQLKSRDVFRDAGLDLTNKQHAAFVKAYDGELSPDAVKTYVTDLGIGQAPPPEEKPGVSDDEQAANIRIAEAARDSGAPTPTPDARDRARRDLEDAMRRKAPQAEIMRLGREFSRAGGNRVKEAHET